MTKAKKAAKNVAPEQVFITVNSYGDIQVHKTAKQAAYEGHDVMYVYDFNKKQQLVVKAEDI